MSSSARTTLFPGYIADLGAVVEGEARHQDHDRGEEDEGDGDRAKRLHVVVLRDLVREFAERSNF